MEQGQPIDINKLKSILAKSKAVMKTVESGTYQTGNIDATALVQETVESLPMGATPKSFNRTSNPQITENMINNSRLPDAIKKAMLNNPIPQMSGPTHTFSLDDVEDLVDKPLPIPSARPRQQVTETYQQPVYQQQQYQQPNNLSDDKIRLIVQEEMTKFFSGYFMKSMTESIQKQTIKNLLETGVIKKKVVNK